MGSGGCCLLYVGFLLVLKINQQIFWAHSLVILLMIVKVRVAQ